MPLTIINGPTFAAGQAISSIIDCSAGPIVRITTAVNWDPGVLTFQVSSDGVFYNDLFNINGHEVAIVAMPATGILVLHEWSISAAYIKFRSGRRDAPKPQAQQCEFAVAILT